MSFSSHALLCGDSQRDSPGDSKATQSLCYRGAQGLLTGLWCSVPLTCCFPTAPWLLWGQSCSW